MNGMYQMMIIYIVALMWPGIAYVLTLGLGHNHMAKQIQREAALVCYRKELWSKLETTILLKTGLSLSIVNGVIFVICNNCYGEGKLPWSVSTYIFLLGFLLQMLETTFILAVHGSEYTKMTRQKWENHFGAILLWVVNAWFIFGGRYNLAIGENGVVMTQLEKMNLSGFGAKCLLYVFIIVMGLTVYRKGKQHFYKKNMER